LEKDLTSNALIVGEAAELGSRELLASGVNWISGKAPSEPFRAAVKIRYKAREAQALVIPLAPDRVRVLFDEPVRDITPGQAAVFYIGEICAGGGLIQS
jgi:tRNA-specific 2-thiouridylase